MLSANRIMSIAALKRLTIFHVATYVYLYIGLHKSDILYICKSDIDQCINIQFVQTFLPFQQVNL